MSEANIPFGKIIENRIYLNAWGSHDDRLIGEVKSDPEQSVKYFENRFSDLKAKVDQLESNIESSQNKGSFLMKLIHLRELLAKHDGLGDYAALETRLLNIESKLQGLIEANRQRNSEIKRALIAEITTASEKINWKEATQEIHDIKAKWIKTGSPKEEDQEELEQQFWGVIDAFFEKKKEFYEDKKRLGDKRKKAYQGLVDEAKKVGYLSGEAKANKINELKSQWEEVGNIQKEDFVPLLKAFNHNLTSKPATSSKAPLDLTKVFKTIEDYTEGKVKYGFKQLEALKVQLKDYRPQDQEGKTQRQDAFDRIQILLEKDFIDKLAQKRFKNFRELEKPKKAKIRIAILQELINRDKADLEKYQENSANFSTPKGGMIDLVEKKISQQQAKIATKEKLMSIMKKDS
ncbi:MAG: DUF349 domain-containing protein [Cyclobacteriaceae bacterium]